MRVRVLWSNLISIWNLINGRCFLNLGLSRVIWKASSSWTSSLSNFSHRSLPPSGRIDKAFLDCWQTWAAEAEGDIEKLVHCKHKCIENNRASCSSWLQSHLSPMHHTKVFLWQQFCLQITFLQLRNQTIKSSSFHQPDTTTGNPFCRRFCWVTGPSAKTTS